MKRTLATSKFIDIPANIPNGILAVTPNRGAASRLGVPHRSLRSLATEILNREGIGVASPLQCLYFLKSTIRSLVPERDAAAEAVRIKKILATTLRDGIDLSAMKRSGIGGVHVLAKIAETYTAKLLADRLVDPENVLWTASQYVRERRGILVYGYFRAREHDIRFIDKVAGDGSVFVVPSGQESIFISVNRSIQWLVEHGWEMNEGDARKTSEIENVAAHFARGNDEPPGESYESIRAFSHSNIEAEVRGTLAAAKKLIVEGASSNSVAIVCRKASDYELTLAAIAAEYGLPVSSGSKINLAETTLGSYIALVLDANETDFDFNVTSRLLNHKYGAGLSENVWTAARRQRAHGLDGWNEVGVDLSQLNRCETASLSEWIEWLRSVVPYSLVRERAQESPAELIACEKFHESIEELRTLDDRSPIDHSGFSKIVVELLQNIDTVIDPRIGGIEFHQPNTIIGAQFDHIFVVGMAEGMLPAITNEDSVIDFYEQRKLERKGVKFDSPVEFPRWEALSFYYVILAAKRSLTFSFPKTVDIEERIESPFFERLSIRPIAARNDSISSEREELAFYLRRSEAPNNIKNLASARHQYAVERRRESSEPYDEYDGMIGIPIDPGSRQWSVSQFTKIGQCPFKWFSEKVLKLLPTEEADADLRSSVMGRLYHKTLQLAAEKALGDPAFRERLLAVLESAFLEAESDADIGVKGLPNWEHRRSEHLATLRKAIESPEFLGEGSHVLATEKRFDVNWNGFRMLGSIDRVDDTPAGVIAIDYKTGTYVGKVKDETGELETDIQLPIYSKVALEAMFPGRVALGHYLSLRQTKIIPQRPADIDGFATTVRKILASGNFSVDPDRKKKSCKYCEYDPVCRRGQRNSRKPRS